MERALIAEYERDIDRVQAAFVPATRDIALELAALPLEIRGFGPVKAASAAAAAVRRDALQGGAGRRRMAEGAGGRVGGRS